MLEEVKKAAGKLDIPCQEVKLQSGEGDVVDGLTLKHGDHTLLAIENHTFVVLSYPMDFDPKDSEKIANQDPKTQRKLFTTIRREMLQGRTGFNMNFDSSENPPHLKRIVVDQKIIVDSDDPHSLQRLLDAIQEIVVIAFRAQQTFKVAFGESKRPSATSEYHDAMYS